MNEYITDFSYLDSDNAIRRKRDFLVSASDITHAILIIKTEYHVIRIREIKELNTTVSDNYKNKINYHQHSLIS